MTAPGGFETSVRITAQNLARQAIRETVAGLREVQSVQASARTAAQQFSREIALSTRDFRAGRITAQDYATAIQFASREARQAGVSQGQLDRALLLVQQRMRVTGVVALQTAGEISALGQRALPAAATAAAAVAGAGGLARVGTAARQAGTGLGTMRSSLASLTAMMIGVRGTVGTLAGGLLLFAGGNAIALGVVAGIAAIAGAWRLVTKEQRAAREEGEKVREELRRSADASRSAREQLDERRRALERLHELEARPPATTQIREAFSGVGGGITGGIARSAAEARARAGDELAATQAAKDRAEIARQDAELRRGELEELRQKQTTLIEQLATASELGILERSDRAVAVELERALRQERDRGNVTLARRLELEQQLARLRPLVGVDVAPRVQDTTLRAGLRLRGPTPAGRRLGREQPTEVLANAQAASEAARATGVAFAEFARAAGPALEVINEVTKAEQRVAQARLGLNLLLEKGFITLEQWTEQIKKLDDAMQVSAAQAQATAAVMITAFSQVIAQLIRGAGGIGGFFGGLLSTIGGVVSRANPLAGALLAAGGGIVSAISDRGRGSDRPTPVHVASFGPSARHDLERDVPDRQFLTFVNPITGARDTYEAVRRAGRRGAFELVPAGAFPGVG